jgi:hypothetical protein
MEQLKERIRGQAAKLSNTYDLLQTVIDQAGGWMEPSDLEQIKKRVMKGDASLDNNFSKSWNLLGRMIRDVYSVINRGLYSRGHLLHPVRSASRRVAGTRVERDVPKTAPSADVVFIHGLDGNAFDTWQFDPRWPLNSWPFWLAKELPRVNVWTLSYPAASHDLKGHQGLALETIAKESLNALLDQKVGERPLIFVTHSLGGLVLKKMTQLSYSHVNPAHKHRFLANYLRGVVFLGTPHNGAYLATLAHKLSLLYGSTATIDYLRKNHPTIDELGQWFREFAHHRPEISIHAHRETANFVILKILKLLIVEPSSADPGIVHAQVFDAAGKDHFKICKCKSPGDPVYKNTRDMIVSII